MREKPLAFGALKSKPGPSTQCAEPQPKAKPKTFETQRNRGSGGQKEETGNPELEEQKPNLTTRNSREDKRKQTSNHKGHEDHKGKAKKISRRQKNLTDSSAQDRGSGGTDKEES